MASIDQKMDRLLANMGEMLTRVNSHNKAMEQVTSDMASLNNDVSQNLKWHDDQFEHIQIHIAARRSMRDNDDDAAMTNRHLSIGLRGAQQADRFVKAEESIAELKTTVASFSPAPSITSSRSAGWEPYQAHGHIVAWGSPYVHLFAWTCPPSGSRRKSFRI
ncbi:unnamed protein product [Prorocentrum cordatum]|uniref:t-SNARE coiled-coil homology domain-containing protein n=1 Tax=Prorocentrum cordatum TaxID=2364126 RepID=A0ABN9U123_9DINO|nr:unnamed protein product [Polarella glacialis]